MLQLRLLVDGLLERGVCVLLALPVRPVGKRVSLLPYEAIRARGQAEGSGTLSPFCSSLIAVSSCLWARASSEDDAFASCVMSFSSCLSEAIVRVLWKGMGWTGSREAVEGVGVAGQRPTSWSVPMDELAPPARPQAQPSPPTEPQPPRAAQLASPAAPSVVLPSPPALLSCPLPLAGHLPSQPGHLPAEKTPSSTARWCAVVGFPPPRVGRAQPRLGSANPDAPCSDSFARPTLQRPGHLQDGQAHLVGKPISPLPSPTVLVRQRPRLPVATSRHGRRHPAQHPHLARARRPVGLPPIAADIDDGPRPRRRRPGLARRRPGRPPARVPRRAAANRAFPLCELPPVCELD